MNAELEQVTPAVADHGEGPVWNAATGVLHWVDMLRGDVLSLGTGDPVPGRRHVGTVAAAVRPRQAGGLVAAVDRGFVLLADDVSDPEPLPPVWTDDRTRMNDGGCDPRGRFYCGSAATDGRSGTAALYRLDADLSVHQVLDGISVSNGLCWSADGTRVFYVDTPTRRVDVFDVDAADGSLVGRRRFADIPENSGMPDGLTVDAEGGVWVALWSGGAVLRFDADGRADARIPVPVTNATACTFGGADLRTLFITTSARDVVGEPRAGALFAARPGVAGFPMPAFAG